jgi:PilZ domain
MEPRYKPRIRMRFPVTFTSGPHIAEGQVLDLTLPGCLIESSVPVQDAQSLQLELYLPGSSFPLSVALGVVRWTKGRRFGVEFIKMHESQQRILQRFVAEHCAESVTNKTNLPS